MEREEVYLKQENKADEDFFRRFIPSAEVLISEDDKRIHWFAVPETMDIMAKESGLYDVIWIPNTISSIETISVIPVLEAGINKLKNNPSLFKELYEFRTNAYEHFLSYMEKYLDVCKDYPDAVVSSVYF